MCCLLVVLSVLGPRVAFALTWLTTERVSVAAHGGVLAPVLGLLFLPWTALAYTFAYAPHAGVTGLGWVVVVLALLADLGAYGSGSEKRRRSRRA